MFYTFNVYACSDRNDYFIHFSHLFDCRSCFKCHFQRWCFYLKNQNEMSRISRTITQQASVLCESLIIGHIYFRHHFYSSLADKNEHQSDGAAALTNTAIHFPLNELNKLLSKLLLHSPSKFFLAQPQLFPARFGKGLALQMLELDMKIKAGCWTSYT